MEDKREKISKNTEKAENLAQKFSEDIKVAAEAMKRTMRHRRTRAILQNRLVYHQIF